MHGWIKVGQQAYDRFARKIQPSGPFLEASKGSLAARWKAASREPLMGSVTESILPGVGMPLEPPGRQAARQDRHMRAMAAYRQARSEGHSHNKALAIARKAFGAVGRALGAGETTESLMQSHGSLKSGFKMGKTARLEAFGQTTASPFGKKLSRKEIMGIEGVMGSMHSWTDVENAIELVGPKGYVHGWHYVGGTGLGPPTGPKGRHAPIIGERVGGASGRGPITIGVGREPGSMGHVRAIWDLGTVAGHNTIDGRPSSDTLGNALHNVARSVAQRDMHSARIHMSSARWANDHEAGGAYTAELDDLDRQLRQVPRGAQPLPAAPANPLSAGYRPPLSATPYQPTRGAMTELNPAGGWSQYANVLAAIEMSAQTARLAVTPAPRGKPGGPGLYDVKGMGHSPYLQNIVKALIRKRGMDPGKAYAIARASIRKWGRGGGHVHPEVRAAAGAAETDELAKQARAKMSHAHSWTTLDHVIELYNPAGNPNQARNPAGPGGGQFTAGGGGQSQQKGKPPARKLSPAQQQARASLSTTLAQQRAQLQGLRSILTQLNSGKLTPSAASSAVSKLSKGSTPAKKGAAATSAKGVATAKAGATATAAATATASKTATATAKKTVLTKQTEAKAINAKITALITAMRATQAQLAKL